MAYLINLSQMAGPRKALNCFTCVTAVLHSPRYRIENAGALRMDWPRVVRNPTLIGESSMSTAKPLARYSASGGALRERLRSTPELHHHWGRDRPLIPCRRGGRF